MAFTHFYSAIFLLAVIASASGVGGYAPNQEIDKPKLETEKLLSTLIGIQGLIYCKLGPKLLPLEGAVARVTCAAEDEHGYETEPVTILSGASDAKGYFFATLSPSEVKDNKKIKECKVFLETSPFLKSCNIPVDVNKGVTGALLKSFRFLAQKNMKLFTVGPFFYTSDAYSKPAPNNGY